MEGCVDKCERKAGKGLKEPIIKYLLCERLNKMYIVYL